MFKTHYIIVTSPDQLLPIRGIDDGFDVGVVKVTAGSRTPSGAYGRGGRHRRSEPAVVEYGVPDRPVGARYILFTGTHSRS